MSKNFGPVDYVFWFALAVVPGGTFIITFNKTLYLQLFLSLAGIYTVARAIEGVIKSKIFFQIFEFPRNTHPGLFWSNILLLLIGGCILAVIPWTI